MSFNPPRSEGIEPTSEENPVTKSDASTSSPAPAPTSSSTTYSRRRMSINSSKSSRTIHEEVDRPGMEHHESVWGQRVEVGKPVDKNDPSFGALKRSLTGGSRAQRENDDEGGEDNFNLEQRVKNHKGALESQGVSEKRLDVAWKDLSVRGVGAEAMFADDIGSMFNPFQKAQDARRKKAAAPSKAASTEKSSSSSSTDGLGKNEKFLLHNFNGVLKSGEMALVVGRPGSGCTSFLKTITNLRDGYAGIDGEVHYGDMDHKDAKQYPGQIVFNAEDDTHYPVLTVGQTLEFALKMKTPRVRPDGVSRKEYEANFLDTLLKTFGIEHTKDTVVGNEIVRGVSGGERKRVSIAEVLVNRASVVAWDNSSRGLDASTALEYTRSIRTMTDVLGSTTFVSLYQAGNQIYDLFDKVLVIAAGECIYWGPREQARGYFEGLGFKVPPGANIADYLTSVTVATERVIEESKKHSAPVSVDDFVVAYQESDICKNALRELEDHLNASEHREAQAGGFRDTVQNEKAKSVSKKAPFTAGLWTQVKACTVQQYQLMWNDKGSIIIKQGSSIVQSIILGSLFYNLPQTTDGLFTRGGTIFFILLFNALLGMTEVTTSFEGRAILAKHKSFAMYRPGAIVLAKVLADFPILVAQITAFLLPIYFMSGLKVDGGAFMRLWAITYVTTLALMAFFRAIGYNFSSFEGASAVSGLMVGLLILYTGYLIPQSSMKPWLAWTRWLNPLYYGFEVGMANEFHDLDFDCVGSSLVPSGPGYDTAANNFVCSVQGSEVGQTFVNGDAYINQALQYYYSHLGRNIGIILALWVALIALTIFGVERLKAAGAQKSYLLFQRSNDRNEAAAIANGGDPTDEEQGGVAAQPVGEQRSTGNEKVQAADALEKLTTVFTWKDLDYTVPVPGGNRQLLHKVQGYTKPGSLTALMGASGAGKTTLLDVLALRKDEGVVAGDINVDGRALGASFQRTTGYVGQMDVHEGTQTVREALIFSALLRQPADVSYEEKVAFCDTVLDLLELTDLKNARIGTGLAGLGVEQRKRVTIGVELVAKPILLFLDEPTSGLDGQSSYNILRFLRKLADAGQSMLVTIHQPSAQLFSQFDRLLLLQKGGHTSYFGDLGEHGATMKAYFEKNGCKCPEDANPAEFMIDVISGSLGKGKDWAEVWQESDEYKKVTEEIVQLNKDCADKPPSYNEDGRVYATSMATQFRLVTGRATSSMYRSTEYFQGKLGLFIGTALLNGLSFLQLDNSVASLQNRLFTIFQGMFIAPGLLNQVQPRFIEQRQLFEGREKQSRMYHWLPFVTAQLLGELPYLVLCTTLYYFVWYFVVFPVGLSTDAYHAGGMYAILMLYHFFTLMFGMAIASLAGNAQQAALIVPIFLGLFASFSGVLVPYAQITAFWRYWIYYLNPWTYSLGGQVFYAMRDIPVECKEVEFAQFPPPAGQTCGEYLQPFLSMIGQGYIDDPSATEQCKFCTYSNGNQYLNMVNLTHGSDGGRNIGLTALYTCACLGLVYLFMWLRSRPNKKSKA